MEERIYLVSCVAEKSPTPAPARDLYLSTWFKLARARVERDQAPWFILSAKHGLLDPNTVVEPYDETLNRMGMAARRAWADRVQAQMTERLPDAHEVVIFAGARYRENLEDYLRARFPLVSIPMKGLRIGEQISWLKHG